MDNKAKEIKLVPLEDLKLNPSNYNTHDEQQIDRLCELIKYQGFREPGIVSNRSGVLIAGEGRYLASKKLGLKEMPVVFQDFDSDEQETAFGISTNAIPAWAGLDLGKINADLPSWGPDLDINMLGIKDFVLEPADLPDKSKKPPTKCPNCGEIINKKSI